ncbi:MAG: hypothetical protein U5J63_01750 [Fodinibius sp.]|nr:hypothetical protein [Fodinibius sp.]
MGFGNINMAKKKKGMGVHIMKYRANMLSGHLEIRETDQNQTNILCDIPQNI